MKIVKYNIEIINLPSTARARIDPMEALPEG